MTILAPLSASSLLASASLLRRSLHRAALGVALLASTVAPACSDASDDDAAGAAGSSGTSGHSGSSGQAGTTGTTPEPRPQDCRTFAPIKAYLDAAPAEAEGLTCATLAVPQRRSPQPGTRTIELSYVIAKATGAAGAKQPPLVMVTGGPATPSTDLLTFTFAGGVFAPLRQDRDIILVAERGEQYSSPQIECREFDDLIATMFGDDGILRPIAQDKLLAATATCAGRHADAGVDLGAYNVLEIAHDVHDVVRAAGHDQYAVWGVSFGTGLVQQIAKLWPAEVTAMILDSPVTFWDQADAANRLTGNVHLDVGRSIHDAFQSLFAACQASADCDAKYPNLEATFRAMLADYDAKPADLPFPVGDQTFTYKVTGEAIYQQLANSFTSAGIVKLMPQLITGLAARDAATMGLVGKAIAGSLIPGEDVSSGMTLSVDCSGWSTVSESLLPKAGQGVDDLVETYMTETIALELRQCNTAWKVQPLSEIWKEFTAPLKSDTLPGLIFPGKFDANTHPIKGELIHGYLPRSYVHVVPDRGHVTTTNECATSMMVAFLADPSKDPDATCLDAMAVQFK